jgi:hypothetical protein
VDRYFAHASMIADTWPTGYLYQSAGVLKSEIMPTPEEQKLYTKLSGELQAIGTRHYHELPKSGVSLSVSVAGGKAILDVYDRLGKVIATFPNTSSSPELTELLQKYFVGVTFPSGETSIIAFVHPPTAFSAGR